MAHRTTTTAHGGSIITSDASMCLRALPCTPASADPSKSDVHSVAQKQRENAQLGNAQTHPAQNTLQ